MELSKYQRPFKHDTAVTTESYKRPTNVCTYLSGGLTKEGWSTGVSVSKASPTSQSVSDCSVSLGLALGIVPDFSSLKMETKKDNLAI